MRNFAQNDNNEHYEHQSKMTGVFFWKEGVAFVSCERGIPAGSAGEHKTILLDWADHNKNGCSL